MRVKRVFAAVALLAALSASALSPALWAEIKVLGPDKPVPAGFPVLFTTEGAKLGEPFELFVVPAGGTFTTLYDSQLKPVGFYQNLNPGIYTACLVKYNDEGKKLDVSLFAVTIGGPLPKPEPVPPEPTPPDPVPPEPTPDGFLGLTKAVQAVISKLPATVVAKLPAIADNFEAASGAVAGAPASLEKHLADMTAKNRQALANLSADDRNRVMAVLFKEIERIMDQGTAAGTLTKPEDYVQALSAVAAGLRRKQ